MNNEPVAWIVRTFDADKGKTVEAIWDFKPMNTIGCTPLYTHPAKTLDRELLDKTIIDQQNEIKELRKNLDVALMIVNEPAKTLTDEEWNKAFEYYCETDEGVLKFDLELRNEWKKEQLIRWKEALKKAQEK